MIASLALMEGFKGISCPTLWFQIFQHFSRPFKVRQVDLARALDNSTEFIRDDPNTLMSDPPALVNANPMMCTFGIRDWNSFITARPRSPDAPVITTDSTISVSG